LFEGAQGDISRGKPEFNNPYDRKERHMKRVIVIAVLIAAASSLALSQTVVTKPDQSKPTGEKVAAPASPEQAVRQLFDELVVSYTKNDAAVPTRIFAEDFTFTNPFGEVMTKEQRIGDIKPGGIQFDSYTVDDVKVRVYGDTAVVTNLATLSGKRGDQVLSGQYRGTSVFVKKGGTWQVVAAQSTRLPDKPTP
jgi:ketosteroid isomerase-like protein